VRRGYSFKSEYFGITWGRREIVFERHVSPSTFEARSKAPAEFFLNNSGSSPWRRFRKSYRQEFAGFVTQVSFEYAWSDIAALKDGMNG